MEPWDLRAQLAGIGCTVCGATVPAERISLLAEREPLAFVELRCDACGSATLGFVTLPADAGGRPALDVAPYGEFGPRDEARLAGGPPLAAADVAEVRSFLAGYKGDLRRLIGESGSSADDASPTG